MLLRAVIDADGHASMITVLRSSGYADLDAAAAEAFRRCRFRPVAAGATPLERFIRFRLIDPQ